MNPCHSVLLSGRFACAAAAFLLLFAPRPACAQTADQLVVEGRTFLVASNLSQANARFAQALAVDPNHATGNVLHAVTRLLVLHENTVGSNFLTRLGFPLPGRSVYIWTSKLTNDARRKPLAPAGVASAEIMTVLRTNVLPELAAAGAELAKVTQTTFTLALTAAETQTDDVRVDYGDVRMLRGMFAGMEHLIYTLNGWDMDVPLTTLKTLVTNGHTTAEQVLRDYPSFLKFRTTNDLVAGRTAFQQAVTNYVAASDWLRSRIGSISNLFNLDLPTTNFWGPVDNSSQRNEANFRNVLVDLDRSLTNAVVLSNDSAYTIRFSQFFNPTNTPRSLLPKVRGNNAMAGTWPDLTAGGGIVGGTEQAATEWLEDKGVRFVPEIAPGFIFGGLGFDLKASVVPNRTYVVERSQNLQSWFPLTNVVSGSNRVAFRDADAPSHTNSFYRLSDLSRFWRIEGTVLDGTSYSVVPGAKVVLLSGSTETLTDSGGKFRLQTLVPVTQFGLIGSLRIEAVGFVTNSYEVYPFGSSPLLQTFYLPRYVPPPVNDNFAARATLSGNSAAATADTTAATSETLEPFHHWPTSGRKSVWWTWTAPSSGSVTITTEGSSSFTVLAVYTGSAVSSLTMIVSDATSGAASRSRVTFSAIALTTYQIAVDGYSSSYYGPVQLTLSRP